MVAELSLVIDGKEVRTDPGKTVIQAAMDAGLYIPYLCYYPGMKPYGACRMCVVEIENTRGTPASCTTPAPTAWWCGQTRSRFQELRKGITELVISEHPHGCLTCHRIELCGPQDICLRHVSVTDRCVACPKNDRCELKDTTLYVGTGLSTPLDYKYRTLPVESKDPFYRYGLQSVHCVRTLREAAKRYGSTAPSPSRSGPAFRWWVPRKAPRFWSPGASSAAPASTCVPWARWWSRTTSGRRLWSGCPPPAPTARWGAS